MSLLLWVCAECRAYIVQQQTAHGVTWFRQARTTTLTDIIIAIDTVFKNLADHMLTDLEEVRLFSDLFNANNSIILLNVVNYN